MKMSFQNAVDQVRYLFPHLNLDSVGLDHRKVVKEVLFQLQSSPFTFDTAAGDQTRESINEFLESVKSHDLSPCSLYDKTLSSKFLVQCEFGIIECYDTRFSDEELTEIVEIVKRTLPPPPEDANGSEATKSNGGEGGKQIKTS
ncbi:uncharacterized protein DS421_19g657260 [Arachis hypogaea]|uniref:DNA-directed RNA polymerase III subunit RPC9 n=1 Tax=Arachis hypogaea TaxID=3818 RepID=A0A6B9V930_ARAHY|nr:uncharacterized protein DS421_19g657260 [Arachis hypogaea]